MFCPHCREEYDWDVMVCPTCDVDTVDRLQGPDPTPNAELVSVLSAGDPGVIAVAQSLLIGERIDFSLRGEGVQDLLGVGRVAGFSVATGPAEFLVRAEDAERARELLAGLVAESPAKDDA